MPHLTYTYFEQLEYVVEAANLIQKISNYQDLKDKADITVVYTEEAFDIILSWKLKKHKKHNIFTVYKLTNENIPSPIFDEDMD